MHRTYRHRTLFITAASLLALALLSDPSGLAAPQFGTWSAAENIGVVVNTEFDEFAPHPSRGGLSVFFASNRPSAYGSFGGEDLWVSQRPNEAAPWGTPINLGPVINTGANERSPALSRDGHYLFFASNRAGGQGGLDIWVAWRQKTHDDFGWETPVNVASVNSTATDAGPNFFAGDDTGVPQLYMASNRAGTLDLYVSSLVDGSFQTPVAIAELNTPQNDLTPTVRHDGLEIVFASNRSGNGDLWAATRPDAGSPWSSPVNLGAPINASSSENFPAFSGDRKSLYFNAERAGGAGEEDIYVSTRSGPGRRE
jgi:Tol biopolymer transport system component